MLRAIEAFPYGKQKPSNPMHEKILLLELNGVIGRHFTVGYYDAVMDIFCTWSYPGFMQTDQTNYEERQVDDLGIYCIMPRAFEIHKGSRLIKGYAPLGEILDEIYQPGMVIDDIDTYLESSKYCTPHLLYMNDDRIIISEVSCFCEVGNQFEAFTPTKINGMNYTSGGPVPRDAIRYAIDLRNLGYEEASETSRMVNADKLYKAFQGQDLSYMQQADIMDCIKDTIERQIGI